VSRSSRTLTPASQSKRSRKRDRYNFFKKINLNNIFESAFGDSNLIQQVAHVEASAKRVSSPLKEFFENNSKNLNEEQRKIF